MLKNLTGTTSHHKDNLLQVSANTLGFSQHPLSVADVHRTGIFFLSHYNFFSERIEYKDIAHTQ